MKRKHGTGSIVVRSDGGFIVAYQWRGRRRYRRADTLEIAQQRLRLLIAAMHRNNTDGLRAKSRRLRAEDWIARVLTEAERHPEWDREYLAKVIVAQLSPRRIKRDMFGPCAYCGTWLAGTIDHVIPQERGGADTADNLVSACWSCNSRKGARTGGKWVPRALSTIDSLTPADSVPVDGAA